MCELAFWVQKHVRFKLLKYFAREKHRLERPRLDMLGLKEVLRGCGGSVDPDLIQIVENELRRLEASIDFRLQIQALELLKFHGLQFTEDKSVERRDELKDRRDANGPGWPPRLASEEEEQGLKLEKGEKN